MRDKAEWLESRGEFVIESGDGRPMAYVSKEQATVLFKCFIQNADRDGLSELCTEYLDEDDIVRLWSEGIKDSPAYSGLEEKIYNESILRDAFEMVDNYISDYADEDNKWSILTVDDRRELAKRLNESMEWYATSDPDVFKDLEEDLNNKVAERKKTMIEETR